MIKRLIPFIAAISLLLILFVSCDNRSVDNPDYYIEKITASSDSLYADDNDDTTINIEAHVKNKSGFPVIGVNVNFKTNLGQIESKVTTNNSGIAAAKLDDTGEIGTANIEAYIADSKGTKTIEIVENPTYKIANMTVDPDTIYSDGNLTFSQVSVFVKDPEGYAVVGEKVKFRTDIGKIWREKTTDSTGVATVDFWDNNDVGMATIQASISDASAKDTVWIEEAPEVTDVVLELNSSVMNIDEQVDITAKAYNELGDYVEDGSIIVFSTDIGSFETNQVETADGTATVTYNTGSVAGNGTITASISNVSDQEDVEIKHGNPKNMYLSATVNGELVDAIPVDIEEDVHIEALVEDKYHNPVQNKTVNFETDLGSISGSVSTNDNGIASAIFNPNSTAGTAEITAVADSAQASMLLTITSDELNSLNFADDSQIDINVAGTGSGNQSALIEVELRDMNENLVDEQDTVYFKLPVAPSGTNINEVVFDPRDSIAVVSQEGIAQVTIIAGEESGTARVMAYAFREDGSKITTQKTNIVVHSGPPELIQPFIGDFNTADEIGGGLWQVEAGAMITDAYGNPVEDGTAVHFSLIDPPDDCEVYGAGNIGNENANGDTISGVAFTNITYSGANTNDLVVMRAECGGEVGIDTLSLPLNDPLIEIVVTPGHIDFHAGVPSDLEADLIVEVHDSQGNPINNADVNLVANYGHFVDHDLGEYPFEGYEVIRTDGSGTAYGRIEVDATEVQQPQPPVYVNEVQCTISAILIGTGARAETTLTIRHYVE